MDLLWFCSGFMWTCLFGSAYVFLFFELDFVIYGLAATRVCLYNRWCFVYLDCVTLDSAFGFVFWLLFVFVATLVCA